MSQTTFNFDQRTDELIRQLKHHFGARTKAEVIRKALAVLQLAMEAAEQDGEIAIVDKDKNVKCILIS